MRELNEGSERADVRGCERTVGPEQLSIDRFEKESWQRNIVVGSWSAIGAADNVLIHSDIRNRTAFRPVQRATSRAR